MDTFILIVIISFTVFLTVVIITFLRLAVCHTQPDERIAFMSGPSEIKILGPGWVAANPLRGRLLLVSLKEQSSEQIVDEKATLKIGFSYRVIDIEKAVVVGIRYGFYVLENANVPEKVKERMRQFGFGPVMESIRGLVAHLAIRSFKALPEEYAQDVMQFRNEVNEYSKAQIQKVLLKDGIKITRLELMSTT